MISLLHPLQELTHSKEDSSLPSSAQDVSPAEQTPQYYTHVYRAVLHYVCEQQLASIYTCKQCSSMSKLMEVLDVIMDSSQLLLP